MLSPVQVWPETGQKHLLRAMQTASVLGLVGAAKEMPRAPRDQSDGLPRLLGRDMPGPAPRKLPQYDLQVRWDDFKPDYQRKLGAGAYGGVYQVCGSPDKVVKLFSHSDWSDVVRESRFAQTMKARYPRHFVDCMGMGSAPDGGQIFAVFERATGMNLAAAATRFHVPEGIGHVSQALDILDQLLTIMLDMMKPDSQGKYHFHLDLKPDNIMISTSTDGKGHDVNVTLIDYGIVKTCENGDSNVEDSAQQLFRWFGWELLWVLSSEAFHVEAETNPWEQLPEGFRPFFRRSDFRPAAYRTEQLSPQLLQDSLQDGFFDEVLSPAFRRQWRSPEEARRLLGRLLGDAFHGVAQASDKAGYIPDFQKLRSDVRSLRALASE